MLVVGSALVIVMILGSMCAYVLARFEFPGSKAIYYLMLAGLTFPIFLAIVPLFFTLRNLGLLNTLPGLSLTYVAFALPFTVFFLFAFFKTLPYEISEAAALDGAGEWAPSSWSCCRWPATGSPRWRSSTSSVCGTSSYPGGINTNVDNYVLSQGMAAFASQAGYAVDFGALFAAVVITVTPVLIVYIIFQRQLQGSVSQGTMK